MQIVAVLQDRPGLSTRGVARAVDLCDATAAYHLARLEREGILVAERVGRIVAHFPSGWGGAKARRYAALSSEARIALAVLKDEGMPLRPADVAARAGIRLGAARHALASAVRFGLARRPRPGRYEVVA